MPMNMNFHIKYFHTELAIQMYQPTWSRVLIEGDSPP